MSGEISSAKVRFILSKLRFFLQLRRLFHKFSIALRDNAPTSNFDRGLVGSRANFGRP